MSALVHFIGDDLSHGTAAAPAIEFLAMVGLDTVGAARAGIDRLADLGFIDTAADANDHDSHLEADANDCQLGMIPEGETVAALTLLLAAPSSRHP
jgi:hypothetical protein